jgi:hypothetical protein
LLPAVIAATNFLPAVLRKPAKYLFSDRVLFNTTAQRITHLSVQTFHVPNSPGRNTHNATFEPELDLLIRYAPPCAHCLELIWIDERCPEGGIHVVNSPHFFDPLARFSFFPIDAVQALIKFPHRSFRLPLVDGPHELRATKAGDGGIQLTIAGARLEQEGLGETVSAM